MSKAETQQKVLWTPEEGFDLTFLTIKRVAQIAQSSHHTIKDNVVNLLRVLPVEERISVLEYMLASKERKRKEAK